MTDPTRVLLADDHTLVRQGLRLILEAEPWLTVVGDVADGREAVRFAAEHPVDLAILDITMPRLTGLQAARDPGAVTTLVREFLNKRFEDTAALSPREEEVLKLIAQGHTGKEIAELLFLSPKTVERHRTNILDKLKLRDRVELTRYAIRRGLIQP